MVGQGFFDMLTDYGMQCGMDVGGLNPSSRVQDLINALPIVKMPDGTLGTNRIEGGVTPLDGHSPTGGELTPPCRTPSGGQLTPNRRSLGGQVTPPSRSPGGQATPPGRSPTGFFDSPNSQSPYLRDLQLALLRESRVQDEEETLVTYEDQLCLLSDNGAGAQASAEGEALPAEGFKERVAHAPDLVEDLNLFNSVFLLLTTLGSSLFLLRP